MLGLAILVALPVFGLFVAANIMHRSWKFSAGLARDWEMRADQHAQSALRLAAAQHDLEEGEQTEQTELATSLLELMRQHDKENLALCTFHASRWRTRIPACLQEYYLTRTRV
jgi:hypothetical protein